MTAVTIDKLSKVYEGGNRAVDNISFSLEQGRIFGFLGPNGAGKTTTVKMLCGMLTPTTGKATVFGIDPSAEPEKIHSMSGIVTEHAQMYDHMTGKANLIFYGGLFGMNRPDSEKRASELLKRLGLTDAADNNLGTYSTGMRQRLSLARALMHNPEILFLDEPTSGLDPESAQNVNTLITELAVQGKTVFLCTHQLRYAQELCTEYGLISKGSLLASGNLAQLRKLVESNVKVKIKADKMPSCFSFETEPDGTFTFQVESEREIPDIVRKIVNTGTQLYHVSAEEMSLEDIYFSLMTKSGKENR